MWKFRTPQFVHILDDGPTYDVGDDGVVRKSIIMEMANGDLRQFTSSRLRADWTQALQFLHDMLKGLSYLHEKRVVHRDLKPGNVLFVCPDGLMEKMKHSPGTGSASPPEEICHAKIADLGLSQLCQYEKQLSEQRPRQDDTEACASAQHQSTMR